jgi:glycosyltransferase involved in cell wall biosynthesis
MNSKCAATAQTSSSLVDKTRDATVNKRHIVISSFDSLDNPNYSGGGAAQVEMIARRLAQKFEVTVITAGPSSGTVTRDGVGYRQLPVSRVGPRAGQLLFHAMLPITARKMSCDLWIESFTPPFSTSFVPLLSRARVVGFAQSITGKEMSARYRLPFFLIERLGLRFYNDVFVLNDADAMLIRRYNPAANVKVIPASVDLPRVDDRQFGHGHHILFLGRINTSQKGLDLLLDAYERSGTDLPLVLAGAGTKPEERRLKTLLSATGGKVDWIGHVTGQQKQDLLKESAFVVVPSRHETFSVTALEGMAHGKPVLHFDLPALRWMEGDMRVPCFDAGAFAEGMRDLADDETKRSKLARAAWLAAQRYSRTEIADRYLAAVDQFLGTGEERSAIQHG